MARARNDNAINSPAYRVLAWLGVALQAIALIAVLLVERWNGAVSLGIFVVLSAGFLMVEKRLIPNLLDLLVVLAALINAVGWAFNLFDEFVWYDEVVHFFAPFALTAAVAHIAWRAGWIEARPNSLGFVRAATLIGLGLGLAWEIAEMTFVDLEPIDTIVDLVMDTLGGAVAGVFLGWTCFREDPGLSEQGAH